MDCRWLIEILMNSHFQDKVIHVASVFFSYLVRGGSGGIVGFLEG